MNTIFLGQIWQVTHTLADVNSSTPVVLLPAGLPVELTQLPLPSPHGVFVEVKAFGQEHAVRVAWEDFLSVAQPVVTMPKINAQLTALRIWNQYAQGEDTFSHAVSTYFPEVATLAIAASNSAEKCITTNWNLTKESFMKAFVDRATGIPTNK